MHFPRELSATVAAGVFIAAYGWFAGAIELDIWALEDPVTPRTLPQALAVVGGVLCLLLFIRQLTGRAQRATLQVSAVALVRIAALAATVTLFAELLAPLGFVVAAVLFMASAAAIAGERRLPLLLGVPVVTVLLLYGVLAGLLDVYLPTGSLWGGD